MKIKDLLCDVKTKSIHGDADVEISGISYDSRKVKKGDVFVAIPGFVHDASRFIPQAIDNGASVIVCEKDVDLENKPVEAIHELPLLVVHSARSALADLSAAFFGHPSRKLKIIGVTGTNGKTTTTYFIDSIFRAAGYKTALIGTVETKIRDKTVASSLTTPESYDLQKLFSDMVKEGVEVAVMEVSSHAIALKRIRGVEFDCAIYTNLSHDHLDFHKTLEAYFDTKLNLFRSLGTGGKKDVCAVVNIDDGYSDAVLEEANGDIVSYSMSKKADVRGKVNGSDLNAMNLEIKYDNSKISANTPLVGEFNAYNILASCACASHFGIDTQDIKKGIESLKEVSGRFEKIDEGQDFSVIVDFAHSPDSIEKLLGAIAPFKKEKIILVFGCTGGRDKLKRPVMGRIAARDADFTIITSDDPHNEDCDVIIREVENGFSAARTDAEKKYIKITDRKSAIEKSIEIAKRNDIVVIAGRGHERIQEIKGKYIDLDDRTVARQAIKKRLS